MRVYFSWPSGLNPRPVKPKKGDVDKYIIFYLMLTPFIVNMNFCFDTALEVMVVEPVQLSEGRS
jgi:hypothetical protein